MKTLLGIGIPVVFLILAALSIWYVETRLMALFGIRRTQIFRLMFTGLYLVALSALIVGDKSANELIGRFYWTGGVLWVFLIYLTLGFIVSDLIMTIAKIPLVWGYGVTLGAVVILTFGGLLAARGFGITETEIGLNQLKAPVTVMHISDVHLGHHRGRDYLQKIVQATNARHPDFVIINGDLLDAKIALNEKVLKPLTGFNAPVYFTGGNHEKYVDQNRSEVLLSEMGVNVLRNEIVNTHGIELVGLRYMSADDKTIDLHPSDDNETIKSVLDEMTLDPTLASVFVHHSPVGINYMSKKGAGLVLSGHTHAGQVFPGTILSRLLFDFSRGLKKFDDTQVLVSQGAGTYLAPMRSGSRNEINLLRLVPLN